MTTHQVSARSTSARATGVRSASAHPTGVRFASALLLLFLWPCAHSRNTFSVDQTEGKPGTYDLNRCFVRKNLYVQIHERTEKAVSINFKDDCLRACMRALVQQQFVCRSLMHLPQDNDCILTHVNEKTRPTVVQKQEGIDGSTADHINYYENQCAELPVQGGRAEAKLHGYKGEGIVEMVQDVNSKQAYAMAVLADLDANERYGIHYRDEGDFERGGCRRLSLLERQQTKTLFELKTDHTGMAVQPWQPVLVDMYGQQTLVNKTLLVLRSSTKELIDCGQVRSLANFSDFARLVNDAVGRPLLASSLFLLSSLLLLLLSPC